MHCLRQREKRIEIAAAAPTRGLAEGMASVAKYGADFVTRSNYFVTDARQIGDWAPVVLAYHYEMLLAAAAAVSIPSSDSIDYTSRLSTLKREEGEQSRCVPAHVRSGRSPCRRVESFRLGLDARLTLLLQIDGYPTSTMPGCADRSVLTDST